MNAQNFTSRISAGLGNPRHIKLSLDFAEGFDSIGSAIARLPIPAHDIDFLHGLVIGCAETIGNSLRDRIPETPPESGKKEIPPESPPAAPEGEKLAEDEPPAPPKEPESPPAAADKPPETKPANSVISK